VVAENAAQLGCVFRLDIRDLFAPGSNERNFDAVAHTARGPEGLRHRAHDPVDWAQEEEGGAVVFSDRTWIFYWPRLGPAEAGHYLLFTPTPISCRLDVRNRRIA
jgi:hypothetical protein